MSNDFKELEALKENIRSIDGRLPTKEEMEIALKYLLCLNMYKNKPQTRITEKELLQDTPLWLSLTKRLGNGDPIKAATRHAKMMLDLHQEMELSTSDGSILEH